MNVHVSYKVHKTPDIEKEISHQIEKIQKRLHVFRPELVHLKAAYRGELSARGDGRLSESAPAFRPTGSSEKSFEPDFGDQRGVRRTHPADRPP